MEAEARASSSDSDRRSRSGSRLASPASGSATGSRSSSPRFVAQTPRGRRVAVGPASDSEDSEVEALKRELGTSRPEAARLVEDALGPARPASDSSSDEGVLDDQPLLAPRPEAGGAASSSDGEVDTAVHDKRGRRRGRGAGARSRPPAASARMEIQSESNRLLRESATAMPYHRPQAHSWAEFRQRMHGLPDLIPDIKLNPRRLAHPQELAQVLEARTQAASQFFQSAEVGERDSSEDDRPAAVDPTDWAGWPTARGDEAAETLTPGGTESAVSPPPPLDSASLELRLEADSMPVVAGASPPAAAGPGQPAETRLAALQRQFGLDLSGQAPRIGRDFDDLDLTPASPSRVAAMQRLQERFVRHVIAARPSPHPPLAQAVNLSIVRKDVDERGQPCLKTEALQYQSHPLDFQGLRALSRSERPGAQHRLLRQTLKDQIDERKRHARAQREAALQFHEHEAGPEAAEFDGEDASDAEADDEEETDDEEEEEEDEEGEADEAEEADEPVEVTEKRSRIRSAFLDDEAEEEDEAMGPLALDEDYDYGLEASEADTQELPRPHEPEVSTPPVSGGRDPSRVATPTFSQLMGSIPGFQRVEASGGPLTALVEKRPEVQPKLGFERLFDENDPEAVEEMESIIGLCSGEFRTQSQVQPKALTVCPLSVSQKNTPILAEKDTQILAESERDTQILSETEKDTQILADTEKDTQELVQGAPQELAPGFLEERLGFLLDSDEDESNPLNTSLQLKKKRKRAVVVSDSENEDETTVEAAMSEAEAPPEAAMSETETPNETVYDSEENEVTEADLLKKSAAKRLFNKRGGLRQEFVENEAELSGSELGSEDEDERGLDQVELEEGDLDDLDENEVRDRLGQIHQRQVLDEDRRNVKLLQEAFLEDGEFHSDKSRTRTFKWKNIDESEEVERRGSDDEAAGEDYVEHEEKRRLERLEREKWLEEAPEQAVTEKRDQDSQFIDMANRAMKRMTSRQESVNEPANKAPAPKTSPTPKLPLQSMTKNHRGSFLSRNTKTLDRLAQMIKSKADSRTGSVAKNSKNFVFAALSPKKKPSPPVGGEPATQATLGGQSRRILPPQKKKVKVARSLDENNVDTIFGLM